MWWCGGDRHQPATHPPHTFLHQMFVVKLDIIVDIYTIFNDVLYLRTILYIDFLIHILTFNYFIISSLFFFFEVEYKTCTEVGFLRDKTL